MDTIGVMKMPADFPYRDVFLQGRPQHKLDDSFRLRHPSMDRGKRAKIFAPFDALRGFSTALLGKNILYEPRRELGEDDQREIDRRLRILAALTRNGRTARQTCPRVMATWFVPCEDRERPEYGVLGQYRTVEGVCRRVDPAETFTLEIDGERIPLEDLSRIEGEGGIFTDLQSMDGTD